MIARLILRYDETDSMYLKKNKNKLIRNESTKDL